MKLSTKGKYGLMAVVDLAVQTGGEPVPLKAIAERNQISEGYLEQVFSILKKAGIVTSVKGSQGGYILGMPMDIMTVGMVLRALEGDLSTLGKQNDSTKSVCLLSYCIQETVYDKIDSSVNDIIDQTTIAQIVDHYLKSQNDSALMFFI